MKYWHSDMSGRNWTEIDGTDPIKVIERYYNHNCIVYDADICGDDEIFFIFDTDIMYRLSYSYWIEHNPEWNICDEHYVEEVPLSSHKFPANRDWLDLKRF